MCKLNFEQHLPNQRRRQMLDAIEMVVVISGN